MGARLHVVEHDGAGPLVVLVHGSMDRSTSFARVATELRGHHVIAYDRRGYGRSADAGPPAETLDEHVDDLLALIDGRAAVVAGHSYGGDVALAASIAAPAAVTAVLAFEPPLPWLPWWPTGTAGGAALAAAADPAADAGDAAQAFLVRLIGQAAWDRLPARTRAERRAEGRALLAEMRSLRRGSAPFDPAAVTVPVIVGTGSESLPHFRESAERLCRMLPNAELAVVERATHGAHRSHAPAFAALVRRTLEAQAGAR